MQSYCTRKYQAREPRPSRLLGTLRSDDAMATRKNNNFARASHFFVHFFAVFARLRHENCLILRFREDVNKRRHNFILFLNLDMVFRNSTPGGFAYIWQSRWVGIIAIKTERTQIHFLSDVFAAVASSDRKVPIALAKKRTRWILREKAECKHLTPMRKQKFLKRDIHNVQN